MPRRCKSEFLHPLMGKGRGCGFCQDGAEKRVLGWAVDCYSCLQKANEEKANNSEFFSKKTIFKYNCPSLLPGTSPGQACAACPLWAPGSGGQMAEQHLGHLQGTGSSGFAGGAKPACPGG